MFPRKPLPHPVSRTKSLPAAVCHWVLLGLQIVVGFGLFGLGCVVVTASLPLLWCLCLFRRAAVEALIREVIRRAFSAIFVMLEVLKVARLESTLEEPVPGPALLACNHISLFDVLAVIARVPGAFTFVKSSFVRIPLLRYIILSSGFLPVDPSSPSQSAEAYARALDLLKNGAVFVVFPEGTRSPDAKLGPFQKGAFRLSRAAGVPITPVHFQSTGPLINKKVLKLADGKSVTLRMRVFAPGAHLKGISATTPLSIEEETKALRLFLESQGVRAQQEGDTRLEVAPA